MRGILGSIAELASPKDDNHAEGIAHALGGGMRSIVVEDDQVAADCISWLRENGGGEPRSCRSIDLEDNALRADL